MKQYLDLKYNRGNEFLARRFLMAELLLDDAEYVELSQRYALRDRLWYKLDKLTAIVELEIPSLEMC